jgi:hypothetical protein
VPTRVVGPLVARYRPLWQPPATATPGWVRWRIAAVVAVSTAMMIGANSERYRQMARPIAVAAVSGSRSLWLTTIRGWKPSRRSWRACRRSWRRAGRLVMAAPRVRRAARTVAGLVLGVRRVGSRASVSPSAWALSVARAAAIRLCRSSSVLASLDRRRRISAHRRGMVSSAVTMVRTTALALSYWLDAS